MPLSRTITRRVIFKHHPVPGRTLIPFHLFHLRHLEDQLWPDMCPVLLGHELKAAYFVHSYTFVFSNITSEAESSNIWEINTMHIIFLE